MESLSSVAASPRFPKLAYYVAPFAAYLVATAAESHFPDHYPIAYTAKIVFVTVVCLFSFREWPRFETRGFGWAILFGVLGVVAWIGLAGLGVEQWLAGNVPLFDSVIQSRPSYNPFEKIESPSGQWAFLIVRFLGLAALVPIIEEVFWRGFLMRYLISDKFESVPIGTVTPLSFAIVTFFFALVHPELLAAIAWGAGINVLYWWTRNLWACVVGHSVTNLLLGLYVVNWGEWQLW